jgi:flagellar motility protein MotE (MotC chaperone)
MKLNPATLLILIMFGSFVIILGVMIAIFRPEPTRQRLETTKTRVIKQTTVTRPDTIAQQITQKDTLAPPKETQTVVKTTQKLKPVSPQTSPTAQTSSQAYRQLQQEQKEMALLRKELEKSLKLALTEQGQKLKQLARRCEPLEPGEAVQILLPLTDTDLATVISYMQSAKAAPIITLLKRNGREKAISKIKNKSRVSK